MVSWLAHRYEQRRRRNDTYIGVAAEHEQHEPPSVRIDVAPPMWDSNKNQERANRGEDALFR
jgi:hypothetical protein